MAAPFFLSSLELGFLFLISLAVHKVLVAYLWRPLRIHRALRAQGICGPPFRAIVGNFREVSSFQAAAHASPLPLTTHNVSLKMLPHINAWSAQYGRTFSYLLGHRPRVVLCDPELCKEILSDKLGNYPKAKLLRPDMQDLLENGLVLLEGEKWAQHRRMVNPAFYIEKLKAMTPTFIHLAVRMLDSWEAKFQSENAQVEIDACEEFKALTADIIAHTAFGSSYAEGKKVFELQYEQQKLFGKLAGTFYIPGTRFLPTPFNRHRWRLSKGIKSILGGIIQKRLCQDGPKGTAPLGDDLLGLMLAVFNEETHGSHPVVKMTMQDVIDECKTFSFAGHETTSTLLTWAVFLLSLHPEWQDKARKEVLDLFGTSPPDAESLNQMKIVGMILYEVLRLYPPVFLILREPLKDMKLGEFSIPVGTVLIIPIVSLHIDPTSWGPDAQVFNPERFADGLTKASKHPSAFMPFSSGPRNCVGQSFAMIEARVALCMVLQRFRFRISPGYKHSPTSRVTLQPEHGMQIILERC